ncbi:uncharacterized protein LOC106667494 [Cimex lectularius]|uniref:Ig-like domain-containing protein n=1 Tax=Cimex lectularius TaxID=79782 RepID=A0A8I6RT66_CIMLE|nr:uncharacterized protein LOC106667494 [Cimex lectularius]
MPPFNLVLLCLFQDFLGAQPLVLKRLDVPDKVSLGSSPTLRCELDLNGSKLKYIKWYKDGKVFCTLSPYKTPNLYQTEINGLNTKDVACKNTTVKLNNVTVQSAGIYTCEASTVLQNVMSSKNMSVIVYPMSGPVITGLNSVYKAGDIIHANCTAPPSNPPPTLSWFVNGYFADKFLVHEYTEVVGPGGLYRRILGLKLLARDELFLGPGGTIFLVCIVSLSGFPPWKAIATANMANPSSSLPIRIENEENTTEMLINTRCNNDGNINNLTWEIFGFVLWHCAEIMAQKFKAWI